MTIVVTGASSGIGRAIALACAKPGSALILAARRVERLQEAAAECLALGADSAEICEYDATDEAGAGRLSSMVGTAGSGPVVLVNCAGAAEFGPVAEITPEAIQRQIAVNFLGPVLLTRAMLPHLVPGSVIINILSIAAEATLPGAAAYSGAKAGARHFFRVFREEVRRQGIRVTNVLPGATLTPVWDGAAWQPPAEDMITPEGLAVIVRGIIDQPAQQTIDEITVLPIRGIL